MSMNHIVIDYNIINKRNYVRIVPINSSTDYNIEINKLYTDINTNICDNIHYNCAEWYDRLILDLKYKKFNAFRLDMKYSGLFELVSNPIKNNTNSTVDYDKYVLELNTFVKQKLITYVDDNGDDNLTSLLENKLTNSHLVVENIRNITDSQPTPGDADLDTNKKYNPDLLFEVEHIELTFNSIEQNKDLKYILTNEHILAFLYYLSTILFKDDVFDEWFLKPTGEPLNYQKNEFGITLNEPTLSKPQYRYLFDALNIDIDSYLEIYKNTKNPLLGEQDLDTMTNYKEFTSPDSFSLERDMENQCGFSAGSNLLVFANMPKCNIPTPYATMAYIPNPSNNTTWGEYTQPTTDSTPIFLDTLEKSAKMPVTSEIKSPKTSTIIKNNITNVTLLYNETIKYFNEFEEVSKIVLKTDLGKTLYERVYADISNNSLDVINTLYDLDNIRELVNNWSTLQNRPDIPDIPTKRPVTSIDTKITPDTPRVTPREAPKVTPAKPHTLIHKGIPKVTPPKTSFNDLDNIPQILNNFHSRSRALPNYDLRSAPEVTHDTPKVTPTKPHTPIHEEIELTVETYVPERSELRLH
uniref:Uncharacterized protein n=1 Tax=viral metagenome TaxID=1070528 RepID=A0A6C0EHX7_9ZZZZ